MGRHPVPIAVLRPIAMSRLLTDSLFSAERRASNATEARYGALLSFEKQPRPSKSAAEESQLLCFYYFYRGPPMEHLQQGPVCADALVPHAHPHINKIRITIKTQPLREGFKRHEPLACPSRESQRKRQDKQQSELRTSDEQKASKKEQKRNRKADAKDDRVRFAPLPQLRSAKKRSAKEERVRLQQLSKLS